MELHELCMISGITPEELERIQKGIRAMGTIDKEKIMTPDELAKLFHDTYERLAPEFGYETRKESAVPWDTVPDKNKQLMTAVSARILQALSITQTSEEIPPKVHGHALCGYCGKMYEGHLSLGWYGQRINGQEWVFCSEQHLKLWKFDQAAKKQQPLLPVTLAAIEAIPNDYTSSTAICRTCGGQVPNHVPSQLDPNGVGHPGHRIAIKEGTKRERS